MDVDARSRWFAALNCRGLCGRTLPTVHHAAGYTLAI